MAISDLYVIGNTLRFDVYAQELGTNFNGVTVAGAYSYREAIRAGRDVDAVHQQVYSRLPSSVPNDPSKYNYIGVINADGELTILGVPWIKENTIVKISTLVYKPSIVITDATDVTTINQVLQQAGFSKIIATDLVNQ